MKWTKEEITWLKRNSKHHTSRQLAIYLNRSQGAVSYKMIKLGLDWIKKGRPQYDTGVGIKIVGMFKSGMSPRNICKELGVSDGYVSQVLTKDFKNRSIGVESTKGNIHFNYYESYQYYETEEEMETPKYQIEDLRGWELHEYLNG